MAQFAGGSLCFKTGECTTEECNGKDDNCDGRIDEQFTDENGACSTGQAGPCAAGKKTCVDAGILCVRTYTPVAETCNGKDDDCKNGVDDGFDLTRDNLNCGACAHACASGTTCFASACRETACDDGLDNDFDGGADCLDAFCAGKSCGSDGGLNCGATLVPNPVDAGADDGGSDAGVDDGGTDGGPIDAGFTLAPMCVPRESVCGDGLDDDLDGRADCADEDCAGQSCDGGTCMMGSCR